MLLRCVLAAAALALAPYVKADTEIVNVRVPMPPTELSPAPSVLTFVEPSQRTLALTDTNHTDLYFAATLAPGGWTARISWAASTPTRFKMVPYANEPAGDGTQLVVFHVHAGALSARVPPTTLRDDEFETPFHILVEPLLLGFLPRTAVSVLIAIIVLCTLSGRYVLPRFIPTIQAVIDWTIAQAPDEPDEPAAARTRSKED